MIYERRQLSYIVFFSAFNISFCRIFCLLIEQDFFESFQEI